MKALKHHILERLILSKTSKIPDTEFNIHWPTDSITKFYEYYKVMNEKHRFNLPDIYISKTRPIEVVYYDKFDPSDNDQNTFEWVIYKIKENIKFSELYDIIIKYFEDNTDYLDESLNERLVLSKNRNRFVNDDEKFIYNRKAGVFDNSLTFIYDYYLKRVKIDGYKKLEDNETTINVYFAGKTIYYQYKGHSTRYIMTEVEDGDTFEKVYDRMIDTLKDRNISLLESLDERLILSKNNLQSLPETKFKLNPKTKTFNNAFAFIHDYYLEQVEIDGYTVLGKDGVFNLTFVETSLFHSLKGKMHRPTLITIVEDGETFKEVYDRIIEFYKNRYKKWRG